MTRLLHHHNRLVPRKQTNSFGLVVGRGLEVGGPGLDARRLAFLEMTYVRAGWLHDIANLDDALISGFVKMFGSQRIWLHFVKYDSLPLSLPRRKTYCGFRCLSSVQFFCAFVLPGSSNNAIFGDLF